MGEAIKQNIYIFISLGFLLTEKNPTYRPEGEGGGGGAGVGGGAASRPARPRSCLCSALDQFGEVA